ncbi:hypothetical protein ACHWQZ_G013727 [Mnemiopsis leidyi]
MMTDTQTKIFSWNIQSSNSVGGSKFDESEFCRLFEASAFVCLQEIRQPVKHPGFRSFNNTRKTQKHGGVSILVRNDISKGVHQTKCSIEDVVICKLDKIFFNLPSDLFLINAYIKPAQTSCLTSESKGLDSLKDLDQLVNRLLGTGEVLLCGDYNARIGQEPDYIINDTDGSNSFIPISEDYIAQNLLPRNTQDMTSNTYKRPFLDMVINNRLHILNGRTLGDSYGELTCIQSAGASVVDYFIASQESSQYVAHMKVLPFTIFSDHKPLELTLNFGTPNNLNRTPKNINELYEKAPLRYKMNADYLKTLQQTMQNEDHSSRTCRILEKEYSNDKNGAYSLNNDITNHFRSIADSCLQKTKHAAKNKSQSLNKKPWFNTNVREAKQNLGKATRIVSEHPNSDYLRKHFYLVKKTYKRIKKLYRDRYFNQLNKDIESGNVLNWKQFKKLKDKKSERIKFDGHDLENFENFFRDLYSNTHGTITTEKKQEWKVKSKQLNEKFASSRPTGQEDIINLPISTLEIKSALSGLKNGKSSAEDMICNEILKSINDSNAELLAKLFNKCLETGTYPWNNNIITPLHKKGCKSNPDNYRAVAVSSTIGKLFSTVLLHRILKFKKKHCPDPINQLGFSKGAQTTDHILTLSTIISKYKKLKAPVYAIFVDFRKAFDSVCREALCLKLARSGINGNLFNTIQHMYENSTGQIKLEGHVSNRFDINKGTEQGHPLSPDLFKIYINELSPKFDECKHGCPKLIDQIVSHLLWADDLILLALDPSTLQTLLNVLHEFCQEWGIDINIEKTKLIKFNSRHEVNSSDVSSFYLGSQELQEVESYCYLGIQIHKSGSFAMARSELKQKAMRALYGLKNTVNKSKLSFRSLTTLFDSLIKPIVLYGAPIYTPNMSIIKTICKNLRTSDKTTVQHSNQPPEGQDLIKKLSLTNCEKVHLHFLKWALGVHRRASNAGVWGESGRYPLIYESINLTLNYIRRLQRLNNNSLVSLALKEQQKLKLDWWRGIEPLLEIDPCFSVDHVRAFTLHKNRHELNEHSNNYHEHPKSHVLVHNGISKKIPTQTLVPCKSKQFAPYTILKSIKVDFKSAWNLNTNSSSKLEFYQKHKSDFNKESYLDHVTDYTDRVSTTRLRISAHRLEIELGRRNNTPRNERLCRWCRTNKHIEDIENEHHFIYKCNLHSPARSTLVNKIKITLANYSLLHNDRMNIQNIFLDLISTSNHIQISPPLSLNDQKYLSIIIANYIASCFKRRHNSTEHKE